MTFVLLGSHAERQSQEGRKQTGRKGGRSRCIFSCALPPRSVGRQLGRRAQGQMVAAGARAQRAAQGISLCTYWRSKTSHHVPLEQRFASLCHSHLASVTQRCFQDLYGAFFLQRTTWGLCTSHPAGIPIFLAQGHLPPGASLVPEEICLSGHFQQALRQSVW